MKYKLSIEVDIPEEDAVDFEDSLEDKSFDFFRYLTDNNADIRVVME